MDNAFHIKPFGFDRIFSVSAAPGAKLRDDDLLLQIASLEADLAAMQFEREALLAAARSEAFDEGLRQARAERETTLLAAVDALQATIEALDQELDQIMRDVTTDAAEVALAAGDLIAARAVAEAPGGAIGEAIGRVLKQVARGQHLLVRVHPDLVEDIERLIAVRQDSDRRQLNLHVAGDATLALGDAQIEWDQGELVLDAADRAAKVRAELAPLLARR